jgi:maltose alpha-D-glucosyltransferase/alpha-amylase
MLKLFRRLERGLNPELEISQFLNARGFPNIPALAGALEYFGQGNSRTTLAVAHRLIPSAKNAWSHALEALGLYYDRVITWVAQNRPPPSLSEPIQLLNQEIPSQAVDMIGPYLEAARLLGVRAAELHVALASDPANEDFAPEMSTPQHRRAVFQSMRNLAVKNLRLLREALKTLAREAQPLAQRVVDLELGIIQAYRVLYERQVAAQSLRIHGDFHLAQALWTGTDFIFIDFEGDPSVSISERRIKRSPLRDVASMVRSFHYAAYAGLEQYLERGGGAQPDQPRFEAWLRYWALWTGTAYLKAYFQTLGRTKILTADEETLHLMLRAYLVNHTLAELGHELRTTNPRLKIPLRGLLVLLGEPLLESSGSEAVTPV